MSPRVCPCSYLLGIQRHAGQDYVPLKRQCLSTGCCDVQCPELAGGKTPRFYDSLANMSQPCPVKAGEGDRIQLASRWELMSQAQLKALQKSIWRRWVMYIKHQRLYKHVIGIYGHDLWSMGGLRRISQRSSEQVCLSWGILNRSSGCLDLSNYNNLIDSFRFVV